VRKPAQLWENLPRWVGGCHGEFTPWERGWRELDFEAGCATVGPLVQGAQASKPHENRIQNEEARQPRMKHGPNTNGTKTDYWSMGAMSGRSKVGLSGFKRAGCRKGSRICLRKFLITRLTRIDPVQHARSFQARHDMGVPSSCSCAKRGRKKFAKVRIVSRSYAKFHESSHRSGPWLRDVTHFHGWDQFLHKETRK
jgi:hypothetical protein